MNLNNTFMYILNCEFFNQQKYEPGLLTFNHLCHITIRVNTSNVFGVSWINVSSKKKC